MDSVRIASVFAKLLPKQCQFRELCCYPVAGLVLAGLFGRVVAGAAAGALKRRLVAAAVPAPAARSAPEREHQLN